MTLTRRQALAAGAAMPAAAMMPAATRADGHAAASPRGASHRVHRMGETEIVTLLDATVPSSNFGDGGPQTIFGMNVDAETFDEVSAENFLSTDGSTFFFTPVLVRKGGNAILFDTGLGQGGTIAALEEAGHSPEDITHVVITHMHGDHIGGLSENGTPTFANAQHIAGEVEMTHWAENPNDAINAKVLPIRDAFELIGDGAEIAPGVTAMASFGHTPGHMAFRIDDGDRSMLIAGDLANHHVWSLAYPDWEVRFDMDKEAAAATRRRVLGMLASERMAMAGYHMPFPGSGFVQAEGDNFRWVPTSYQFL